MVEQPTLCQTPVGLLWLYPNDLIGMTLAGGQFWDGELLLPLFDAVKPGEVVINIGAYIGHEAIYLAEQRDARVLAFECNFPVFELLARNLTVHQADAWKVIPYYYAAYDRAAWFALYPGQVDDRRTPEGELDLAAPGSVGSLAFVPTEGGAVRGGPLDPFVFGTIHPQSKVTLIECDAQGCDLRALMGLRETIKKWRPVIVFEYEHPMAIKHGDDWAAHERFMEEIGYYFSESQTHGQNYICRPR